MDLEFPLDGGCEHSREQHVDLEFLDGAREQCAREAVEAVEAVRTSWWEVVY